jgi:hypothetical protein
VGGAFNVLSDVITYAANSYCSRANRLRQYSTVCRLMMIETCCGINVALDGPIIALLIIHTQVSQAASCLPTEKARLISGLCI